MIIKFEQLYWILPMTLILDLSSGLCTLGNLIKTNYLIYTHKKVNDTPCLHGNISKSINIR